MVLTLPLWECWVCQTLGWRSHETCCVFNLVFFTFQYMTTTNSRCIGIRWNSSPSVKLQKGDTDQKRPPEPPVTRWLVVNGWNVDFGWTLPLRLSATREWRECFFFLSNMWNNSSCTQKDPLFLWVWGGFLFRVEWGQANISTWWHQIEAGEVGCCFFFFYKYWCTSCPEAIESSLRFNLEILFL